VIDFKEWIDQALAGESVDDILGDHVLRESGASDFVVAEGISSIRTVLSKRLEEPHECIAALCGVRDFLTEKTNLEGSIGLVKSIDYLISIISEARRK